MTDLADEKERGSDEDRGGFAAVAPWHWQGLDATAAAQSWAAVSTFVGWLVHRYDLGDLVPPCWWAHGALVEELTGLWAAWTAAYAQAEATSDAPLLWLERFGAARLRLAEWDRLGCAQRGHRATNPADWVVDETAYRAFVAVNVRARSGPERMVPYEEGTPPC